MADYDSSLPIRTENDGDVVSKISDATIPSQQLKVNADGSLDVNTTIPGTIDVSGSEVSLDAATLAALETTTVVATDLDIRDLAFATDSVDASGSEVSLDAATLAALETTTVIATDLDIRDLTFATDTVDASGSEVSLDAATLAALENVVVSATDLDIRDLVAATDSVQANLFDETGAAYSQTNPLPVFVEGTRGDKITDYNTTASVVKNATATHSYTVTAAKTFCGEEMFVSGSGKIKAEVKVGANTVFVGFNSTSNPNIRIPLDKAVEAAAGVAVSVVITNKDNQAQDVYSTLTGTEK